MHTMKCEEESFQKCLKLLMASLIDFDLIKQRAEAVSGISGDLRLDGFATRLSLFKNTTEIF